MKINKNISFFLIMLTLIGTAACSSDDEGVKNGNGNNPENGSATFSEKLVGTWLLRDREEIGIEVCELSTRLEFKANRQMEFEKYFGGNPNNCSSQLHSGTWSHAGNSKLIINFDEKPKNDTLRIDFKSNAQKFILTPPNGAYKETYKKQ